MPAAYAHAPSIPRASAHVQTTTRARMHGRTLCDACCDETPLGRNATNPAAGVGARAKRSAPPLLSVEMSDAVERAPCPSPARRYSPARLSASRRAGYVHSWINSTRAVTGATCGATCVVARLCLRLARWLAVCGCMENGLPRHSAVLRGSPSLATSSLELWRPRRLRLHRQNGRSPLPFPDHHVTLRLPAFFQHICTAPAQAHARLPLRTQARAFAGAERQERRGSKSRAET